MVVEQSQTFETNREKYKDIREAFSDSYLDDAEKEALASEYYAECEEISSETHDSCSELEKEVELYREIVGMSQWKWSEIEKLQILSWVQDTDGLRGPTTFASYLEISNRWLWLEWLTPKQVVEKYDEIFSQIQDIFNSFTNKSERQEIQRSVWASADGIYGPNTFKAIMKNSENDETINELFFIESNIENTDITEEIEPVEEDDFDIVTGEEVQSTTGEEIQPVEGEDSDDQDRYWDYHPDLIEYNNIWKTEAQMDALRDELRWSEEYNEARIEARSLSRQEVMNLQTATWSDIDGQFGINTYIYYRESDLATAWFSISEVWKLEKIVDEWETEQLSQDIAKAYGIEVEDISEIFSEISPWDYFSYNKYYGRLTLFDNETSEKVTIDVAEGLFDTIENSFLDSPENARLKISSTLSRISWESERGHYIDQILLYIDANEESEKARWIFTELSNQWNYKLSLNDFDSRWKSDLILKLKAVHLFWDHDVLKRWEDVYIKNDWEYYSVSSRRRLSIWEQTEISIPNPEEKREILLEIEEQRQQEQIRTDIEGNLTSVISRLDRESILMYCKFSSTWDKRRLLQNIKTTIFEERLFSSMRLMFADISGDDFTFNSYSESEWVWELFENWLSAFELFWDYEKIIVNNREYSSWNTRRYWVSIHTGDIIQMIWSPRTAEDYENLTVRSNYNVHALWRPQFMRNPVTWTTLCWATARVFADRIWAPWTPSSTWYAFNQFKMMPEPKAWQVPNSVRQINKNYNMWLGEITTFLQNTQTQVAQIYLDAAGSYSEWWRAAYYGHVATVVLDRSWEPYVFDAYQNGGAPMKLSDYYSIRRWQISAGTWQRKDFKGIAKLK